MPLDPPELLDYEGAESVLVGATAEGARELDIELHLEDERLETADVFGFLGFRREELPTEPLERGELR